MNNQNSHVVAVRITPDGTCFIDDEYFSPPPGAAINAAVLEHLRLESAALEIPLRADIVDDQSNYFVSILVNPDGSSTPAPPRTDAPSQVSPTSQLTRAAEHPTAGAKAAPNSAAIELRRPYEALPEPFRTRLQAACAAIEAGNLAEATNTVDTLIAELSQTFGPHDRAVLAAGIARGDIALITHDHEYGLRIWAFIAETWQRVVGPNDLGTIPIVNNALWCWSQLPEAPALATRDTIITLLQRVPVPGRDASQQNVYRRLQQLAQR